MVPPARSVAIALLGVAVLVGAAGGTAYYLHQQPVPTDYEVPRDAEVPFDHYELRASLTEANGTTRYVLERTVTPERRLLTVDLRQPDGRTLERRLTADPFVYAVERPATAEEFRQQFDHRSTRWVAADTDSRTVYALAWDAADVGWVTGERFASRFAFRRTGDTTYHGVSAETYAVKSWWLPRAGDTWEGSGRLVVAKESGAVLRFAADTTRRGSEMHFEHRVVPIEPPEQPIGVDVVRAVRRNVTVNTSIYPDRLGVDPAANAFGSGDVVGVEFEVDGAAPAVPAGSRVVATDRNGTTYAATLAEPFRPSPDEDSRTLDLAFAVEDGALVRTAVGGEAEPLRPGPDLRRLVVRDPERGWTYVNATVRGEGVADVRLETRTTLDEHRYAWLTTEPATGGGVLRYRLYGPDGTEAASGDLGGTARVALVWADNDSLLALTERPGDEWISAPNGTTTRRYRLVVTGPRGRLANATVRLDRPVRNATAS